MLTLTTETSEHLHFLASLVYYSRIRFTENLLPLLKVAPSLRRVVCVAGGGLEGPIDTTDFPGLRIPFYNIRKHLTTLVTLGFEALALQAPDVSFIHEHPGTVKTDLMNRQEGWHGVLVRACINCLGRWICIPIDESGERHLYLATSARFPPANGKNTGIQLGDGVEQCVATTGEVRSGMYSVGWNGESAAPKTLELLAGLREKGIREDIWHHTQGELKRITES